MWLISSFNVEEVIELWKSQNIFIINLCDGSLVSHSNISDNLAMNIETIIFKEKNKLSYCRKQ